MTDKLKSASDWTKMNVWKYFGAMFMEKKEGVQAVSLTRLLALVCFGMLVYKWSGFSGDVDPQVMAALVAAEIDVPLVLKATSAIPESLLYTFWGLLGGKMLSGVAAVMRGKKEA